MTAQTKNAESYFKNIFTDKLNRRIFIRQWGVLLVFAGILLIIGIIKPNFYNSTNIKSILNIASIIGFITLGETLVVITRDYDLSVGNLMGLCTVGIAIVMIWFKNGNPILASFISFLMPLAIGLFFGLINSLSVVRLKIPSFIATIGIMWVTRGIAYYILRGVPKPVNDTIKLVGRKEFFNLPLSFIVFIFIAVIFHIVLTKTRLGLHIYSLGSDSHAALISGVSFVKIKTFVYVMSGFFAGLAAIFLAGWTGTGYPRISDGYEMYALSGVALGGISFSGGSGNVFTPFVGICILQILDKFMIYQNISPFISNIFVGSILIISLYIQYRGAQE
ncbi:MAG: ABC transporter permease [Actinobacteria bacterium]|nr:ABC transporter permease [Actinomycetota bacterium]